MSGTVYKVSPNYIYPTFFSDPFFLNLVDRCKLIYFELGVLSMSIPLNCHPINAIIPRLYSANYSDVIFEIC